MLLESQELALCSFNVVLINSRSEFWSRPCCIFLCGIYVITRYSDLKMLKTDQTAIETRQWKLGGKRGGKHCCGLAGRWSHDHHLQFKFWAHEFCFALLYNLFIVNIRRDTSKLMATLSDAVSAELLKASLEYMRTPSPELQEAGNAGQYWIVDSVPAHSRSSSSPVLACPPSWLHDEQEISDLETENDEEFLSSEVPLSSSPPDLTSSSPQSDGSDTSDDISTSLTSSPDDNLVDPVSVSRLHSSLVDLPTGASLVLHDFGTRLQYLLLIALKERQREGHDLNSPPDRTDDLSDCDLNDCGYGSPDGSCGISDDGSNKNTNTTVERSCLRTPRKSSECLDHFEPCSLSLSNGLREASPVCFTANDVTE
jgi:hypothetical protein